MRQMKDSGVEWIGEIPQDWAISNIKSKFVFGKGLPITKDNLVSKGSPVISYGQIHSKSNPGTKVTSDLIRYVNESEWTSYKNAVATRGNFVFADTSEDYAGCGNCTYIDTDEKIFAGYHTILLKSKDIDNKYYAYLFLTDGWRKQIREKCAGVKLFSITQRNLKSAIIINPPFDEQQKIADYLDKKCTEIDNAISKTTASIEEYKKLKQAIITKAVTKGIRGNRPMKDSGIEWIGEIPAVWEVNKAFQLFREVKNKNIGLQENNLLSLSYGNIKRKDINTNEGLLPESFEGYNIIDVDNIVLRLTDLQNDHKSLRVGLCKERGIITSAYVTLDNFSNNLAGFLYYQLHAFDVAKGFYSMGGGVRQSLNWDGLKNHLLAIPPIDEQREILRYLHEKTRIIDELVSKKELFIIELEKYKKSLIYEYVTGKKEVV